MSLFYRYSYRPLQKTTPTKFSDSYLFRLFSIIFAFCVGFIIFYMGRISQVSAIAYEEPHLNVIEKTFQYDRLFGSHPSAESDYAWLHLFPSGGGFFKHPIVATKRSVFSTFHQLHCLDGIRHGYWTLYDAATSGQTLNETTIPMRASPPHIRHCIDLLRQALMCRPDLTVEEKNEDLDGVTGFGTTHQCYDWDQLVTWTREWQDWDAEETNSRNLQHAQTHTGIHGPSHK